jgi:hypothetical protein
MEAEDEDATATTTSATTTNMTSNSTHVCHEFADCEPCLNSRVGCVWTSDTYELSCVIADAGCCTSGVFDNMTGPENCAVEETGDEVSFEGLVEAE